MTLPVQNLPPPVCRRLRTKQTFMHASSDEPAWQTGESLTATYWCLRTMGAAGPDGAYVHAHACREGRECFEVPQ